MRVRIIQQGEEIDEGRGKGAWLGHVQRAGGWDLVTRAGLGTSGSRRGQVPGVGVVVAVPEYSFFKK